MYRAADLRKVTEIFTRMFYDPQSKVFSLFAETVVEFVSIHADDLSHWLPILLPRLLLKLVSDLRGSIYTKVEHALQAVRCSQLLSLNAFITSDHLQAKAPEPYIQEGHALLHF